MIGLAKEKMPNAKLFDGDFSKGIAEPLKKQKYDAIIATYSLHHLTDEEKIDFISSLLPLLNENGRIYLGDVAFNNRKELLDCMEKAGDEWDDEEIYFVFDELKESVKNIEFEKISHCAGVITIH